MSLSHSRNKERAARFLGGTARSVKILGKIFLPLQKIVPAMHEIRRSPLVFISSLFQQSLTAFSTNVLHNC